MVSRGGCWVLCGVLLLGGCSDTSASMDSGRSPLDLAPADLVQPDLARHDLAIPDLAIPDLTPPDLTPPDLPPLDLPLADQSQTPDISPDTSPAIDATSSDLGPPPTCGSAPAAYSGTLCGPASNPCKVKVNETLPGYGKGGYFHAMALDAKGGLHMLSRRFSPKTGYHHHRPKGGKWIGMKMPFVPAMKGLTATPKGDVFALNNGDTTYGLSLFKLLGKGWKQEQVILNYWAPLLASNFGDLLTDSMGCLHARRKSGTKILYMQRGLSGKWKEWTIPTPPSYYAPVLTLSAAGVPHFAYWQKAKTDLVGWWTLGLAKGEKVHSPSGWSGYVQTVGMAVTGSASAEVPHLLFRHGSAKKNTELLYASRKGGVWTQKVLGIDGGYICGTCKVGGLCPIDYYTFEPMFVVASGSGDVRLFYLRTHHHGNKIGKLEPVGSTHVCKWMGGEEKEQLMVAWLAGGKIKSAGIKVLGQYPWNHQAVVDKSGDIHLGFSSTKGPNKYDVHHMVVGK